MQWTNGAYEESWTFAGTTLSEIPTSVALQTSHFNFHASLSPVVSLSLGILHEWMSMQMLAKTTSNLLQRTGNDHQGCRAQPGWRTFMMTRLRWILGYMRLEIWCKIGLSGDWCLCIVLRTCSSACYYWIGYKASFIWWPKRLVTLLNLEALYKQTYLSIYLSIYLSGTRTQSIDDSTLIWLCFSIIWRSERSASSFSFSNLSRIFLSISNTCLLLLNDNCLQCFDTVGWASGRASGL